MSLPLVFFFSVPPDLVVFLLRPWRWLNRWSARVLWRAQVWDGRTVWKPGRAGEAQSTYIYRAPQCQYVPSSELGSPNPSLASVPLPPVPKGGGILVCGWGVGGVRVPTTGGKAWHSAYSVRWGHGKRCFYRIRNYLYGSGSSHQQAEN